MRPEAISFEQCVGRGLLTLHDIIERFYFCCVFFQDVPEHVLYLSIPNP